MRKTEYTILKTNETGSYLNFPIYLESSVDEMGVMVSFDGYMEQVEQLCNFSYIQSGSDITIYNTVNADKLRKIVEQNYTVNWGDGNTTTGFTVSTGLTLNSTSHTYSSTGSFTISLSLDSPWNQQKIEKNITVPNTGSYIENALGTFTGITIPAYSNLTGQTQDYLNNLDYTNNTGHTTFTYMAIGGSRIGELRQYGTTTFTGTTTGTTIDGVNYTGYTIDGLNYFDRADGYTMITGNTTGYTKEEVVNYCITRNEHFIGFIDDPQVYSDVFVERGKLGVMEKNLRLGEIDNMDELDVYGNGYFKVRKQ